MTQKELAELTGLSQVHICRMLNGRQKYITTPTARAIAEALSMETSEVVRLLHVKINDKYWVRKNPDGKMTFLRAYMYANGITTKELAKRSYFSFSFVNNVASGCKKPSMPSLIALARAIGYSPEYAAHLLDRVEYSYVEETLDNGLFPWEKRRGGKQ